MKKMILLFSHQLTQTQMDDAINNLHIEKFVSLPEKLQNLWSNVSPNIPSIQTTIKPIFEFLQGYVKEGDYVLIQGDFGAVYLLVNYTKKFNAIPVYATTERDAFEYVNSKGEKVKKSKFKFVRFREYE